MTRESYEQYIIRRFKEERLKIKSIIAGGCSFTYNNEMTWAGEVAKHYHLINVGSCASGNDYIARSVIHEMDQHNDQILLVCQWSGIHRKSYYIDSQHVLYKELTQSDWPDWAGDYTQLDKDAVKQQEFWVKTGGNNIDKPGSSNLIHEKFVKPYAKYFYSEEQSLVESLENILRVQYYCNSKKIKNIMFWWKTELENYKMSTYSKELYNKVLKQDTVWLEPLGDWCVKHTDLTQHDLDQGEHPTVTQHKNYAEQVVLPALKTI